MQMLGVFRCHAGAAGVPTHSVVEDRERCRIAAKQASDAGRLGFRDSSVARARSSSEALLHWRSFDGGNVVAVDGGASADYFHLGRV
jgi:hypothetical protein